MEFNDYQISALRTRQEPIADSSQQMLVSLLGLSGEAGELISEYKKYIRDADNYIPLRDRVLEELGDILWYVASVADGFNLKLEDVANHNLVKTADKWVSTHVDNFPSFDAGYPSDERLPRRFTVSFSRVEKNGVALAKMEIDGEGLGDPLTDNSYEEDGYRFHDIFHWVCAAKLGWSPVLRKLVRRKRKSVSQIDEVEDGARSAAIEEGMSALVFSYAADRKYLVGANRVDSDLLRTIKGMTRNLEVKSATPGQWEKAILNTFHIWRIIAPNDGGSIEVDLDLRSVRIKEE